MKLSLRLRIFITIFFFAAALVGFMVKLPSVFRHSDKELHAAFYFSAAALVNLLFARRQLIRHVVIFVTLYLFGMMIEWLQQYSNTFFRRRIHGNFDPTDLQWNLKGLLAFSVLWILILVVRKGSTRKDNEQYKSTN